MISCQISNNVESDDTPCSPQVKRATQRNFDPEVFILRRSMSFTDESGEGFMFLIFGKSFDLLKPQPRRMAGAETA